MGNDPFESALHAARAALGPVPERLQFPEPDWSLSTGESDTPAGSTGSGKDGPIGESAPGSGSTSDVKPALELSPGEPVWAALYHLKALCDLLPPTPGSESRLGQCVARMRDTASKELFADAEPDPLADDSLSPISYPRLEVNEAVGSARHLLLELLPRVEFERRLRELLDRELRKSDPFLEEDDRGTIQGMVEPSGPSRQKMRNDSKLHALGVFLDALRRQPFAAVRCAVRLLSNVAIPSNLLSVDVMEFVVTFRSQPHRVSEPAAHFVRLLLAAQGGIVSTGELKKALKVSGQIVPKRLKDKLPIALVAAIVTDQRGSRLDVDQLMSYA
ncbi:hypothetical protein FTUN_2123 [Frigoriglobus tundricola]|uniref:Uncharacterized protein n=2 Tax=Frigoriglobus tundricola TaxID=2774151 RepID=A0A6M5YMZ2_9BACT|nr:hypothetical protein FTUN_2123 [Frigoriglobus tundricola]